MHYLYNCRKDTLSIYLYEGCIIYITVGRMLYLYNCRKDALSVYLREGNIICISAKVANAFQHLKLRSLMD